MGRRLTGQEALQAGLVARGCPKDQVLAQAKEIVAQRLSNGDMPRIGVGEMKEDLYWPVTRLAKKYDFIDRSKL